jgi:hypothetical protein
VIDWPDDEINNQNIGYEEQNSPEDGGDEEDNERDEEDNEEDEEIGGLLS